MVTIDVSLVSKSLAIVGAYVVFVGLVSYFVKNKLFLSEALLAAVLGIITGPRILGWFDPLDWCGNDQEQLNYLTFEITRIVIGIQVLFTGIALPKAYLKREWLSLTVLLGPVMTIAWFVSSLLIWGLIPGLTFLECLVIGACVTPTDPVLANSICKGRFAEKYVPLHVRNIIVAESGANDGLGYPFLYIGLYLILRHTASSPVHTIGGAIGEWVYNIVLYEIALSIVIGAVIGYAARKALKWAEQRDLVDHDNFLAFGVGLTFFTLGVVGMIGSDDILCCFVVGNAFTWDDWFRVRTEEHSFQDVVDTLLNSTIFLYIGSILPWDHFGGFYGITPWRLVVLGILVMLVRRVPWVVALHKYIPTLPTYRESAFAGFFGPIGVGAVFYVQVALRELAEAERERLTAVITPVVYFLVLTSVVVHGITIPIVKGFQSAARRTITLTRSTGNSTNDLVSRLPQAPDQLPKAPQMFEVNMPNGDQQMMDSHDVADAQREGEVRRHGGADGPLHFHHHNEDKDTGTEQTSATEKKRSADDSEEDGSDTVQVDPNSSGDEQATTGSEDTAAKKGGGATTMIRFDVPRDHTPSSGAVTDDGPGRVGRDATTATARKSAGPGGPVSILSTTPSQSRVQSRSGSPHRAAARAE